MSTTTSTHIQLASRPTGWPSQDNFTTVTVTYPDLGPGQIRVRNDYMSVDPYMRGRLNEGRSYIPPFQIGDTLTGGAIGTIIDSNSSDHPVGATVIHQYGWRDIAQDDATHFRVVPKLPHLPSSLYLGMLGMTGLTAYVGLTDIAPVHHGDTVFISGAAGAVGTAAGQIARLLGASTVIGSAGSAEKINLLTSKYGYDVALNYKDAPIAEQLATAAPNGIDVFFDNVGGDHLEAALDAMKDGGRIALCGAISSYNTTEKPTGPRNMMNIISRGLTLKGFTLGGYMHRNTEFMEKMGAWLQNGDVTYDETIVEGIDNAVDAFLTMMQGGNIGKMIVKLS